MSKLEQYITEERNIKSEEAKIIKLAKKFVIEKDELQSKVEDNIVKIMKSVSGSLDADKFEEFANNIWSKVEKIDGDLILGDVSFIFPKKRNKK